MFSKNRNKAPSRFEVALAAVLSVLLGVLAAIVLLSLKPVTKVTAIPKDAPANAIFYIEGTREFSRTGEVEDKRKRFIAGESVAVQEGEMNVFLGANAPAAAPTPPAPKPGAKPDDKAPPAPPAKAVDIGQLNCRIALGEIQFGAPVTFSFFGISELIIVQTSGTFEKRGNTFVYVPDTLYFGGCPLARVPVLRELVMNKLLFYQPVPSDLYNAWLKLAGVTIDGNTLHLRMP